MATGPRRPGFYVGVLLTGVIFGGFLNALVKAVMPDSVARQVFTFTASASAGPVSLNLLVFSLTLGPFAVNVSPLAILGVIIAYLIARTLF